MGIYAIKPAFQRRLLSLRDFLIRAGVSADALTLAVVLLSVAGAVELWLSRRQPLLLLVVPLLAMGRITLNALDGMVATTTGTARPFGEVLNESADRLSDAAWFAGLATVADPRLALGTLAAVLVSSYVGTVSKAAGGPRIYSGVMGKADRMIVVSIGAIIVWFTGPWLWNWMLLVVGAGSLVTVVQRVLVARRSLSPTETSDAP